VLVDRIHPGRLGDQELDVAVVIDVIRATSTAIVLLGRGAAAVRIVERPQDLARLEPGRYLVFSEVEESRGFGLDCVDNSPAVAEEVALDGRIPVLVTTNGTRAVAAAMPRSREVLLASFGNLSSTVRHLAGRADRVTLLPAGDFASATPHAEDERCADALEEMLKGGTPDLAALVAACRDERVERRLARQPQLLRDLEVCFGVDRYDAVAAVVSPSGAGLDVVRLAGD
jgi:phosphosulfolactate phosphohydrolase-like enzyme